VFGGWVDAGLDCPFFLFFEGGCCELEAADCDATGRVARAGCDAACCVAADCVARAGCVAAGCVAADCDARAGCEAAGCVAACLTNIEEDRT
jgi:hypothetical protein